MSKLRPWLNTLFSIALLLGTDLLQGIGMLIILFFWAHSIEAVNVRNKTCLQSLLHKNGLLWFLPVIVVFVFRNYFSHHEFWNPKTQEQTSNDDNAANTLTAFLVVCVALIWACRIRILHHRSSAKLNTLPYAKTRFLQLSFKFLKSQTNW